MNIFSKENRRRMLFTLTLILLTAVLSFGFVSRAVEYLSIRQELMRISDNYRTIGWLTAADGDVAPGVDIIKASPYVETADERGYIWGTLTDLYNTDLSGGAELYLDEVYGVNNAEVLFWGTLKSVDGDWIERKGWDENVELEASRLVFTVSERISGYPDYAAEGRDVSVVITDEAAEAEGWELPEFRVGERYLVRAYYSWNRNGSWNGYEMWKRAESGHALTARSLPGNSPVLPGEEGEEALSVLVSDPRMEFEELNRHSMYVVVTKDMSAMPAAQDVSKRMFLTEGRWLDAIDSRSGAMVCAVQKDFADARGLQVGDTVELTFRKPQLQVSGYAVGKQDALNWKSYDSETRQYTIVGIFDFMPLGEVHNPSSSTMDLYIPYGSVTEAYIHDNSGWAAAFSFVLKEPQDTDAFLSEVQGPLAALGMRIQLIENDWEHFAVSADAMERTARSGVLVFAGVLCLGFILIAFLYGRQNRKSFGIARALGVPKGTCVRMCLSPMLWMSAAGIGAGALCSWHYALGEAERMLTGMQEHAELALSVWWLAGILLALIALLTAETAAGILIMGGRTVTELLREASGGRRAWKTGAGNRSQERDAGSAGAHPQRRDAGIAGTGDVRGMAEETFGREAVRMTAAPGTAGQMRLPADAGRGRSMIFTCRFVLRDIGRRPVHTFLAAAVSLAFFGAVTWMQMSIVKDTEQVERLYETTEVAGEVVKRDISVTNAFGGAYLTQSMLDWIEESGYVYDLYVETGDSIRVQHRVVNAVTDEVLVNQLIGSDIPMRSARDIERFCRENRVEIDYADGYGPELFTADWVMYQPDFGTYALRGDTPILVPEDWLELYDLGYGKKLTVTKMIGTVWTQYEFVIAGSVRYGDYGDGIGYSGGWNKVLIPPSAWEWVMQDEELTYSAIRFTVNPAFNREIDGVKAEIEVQLKNPRMALADADVMLWTSELRQVVGPFEKNLDLMKLLFPVTVAISAIAGGGLIFLLLQQRTEEAALLRVLGSSRGRTRRMLFAEPVLLSLLGLLIGGCVVYYSMPEISTRQILMFAGTYLGGCLIGALAGTIHITRKKPLELLQVKE
ncbi:MAG: ABC transporter permease [bacterium]|nr:ABC transporter permease [bacterium]